MEDEENNLAIEKYKLLLKLWMSENPIKTNKLQVLMMTNSILVSSFILVSNNLWIAVAGFIFSSVWILSIGRTVIYQKHWQSQMEILRKEHADNTIFQIHHVNIGPTSWWGTISSKHYLVGTPIVTSIAWLTVILYVVFI